MLGLDGGTLKVVETIPSTEIPVVADLLGDGRPYLLTAGRGKDGNLWVQARDPEKQPLWRFVFPDSGACGQYSQRPHYLAVGRFTGRKGLDVFTYSTKPAARTYVLDGRTGKPVWEKAELPAIERHFQAFGGRASAHDYDGDGADDVLFLNPDYYCVAEGRSGKLLVGPVEVAKLVKWWAAYASPAVLRREGGPPLIYLGGAYSARCAISLDGQHGLWREYLPTERWPLLVVGERFVEGLLPPSGGRGWRGVQAEADGTLVGFDAATGRVAWRMPLRHGPERDRHRRRGRRRSARGDARAARTAGCWSCGTAAIGARSSGARRSTGRWGRRCWPTWTATARSRWPSAWATETSTSWGPEYGSSSRYSGPIHLVQQENGRGLRPTGFDLCSIRVYARHPVVTQPMPRSEGVGSCRSPRPFSSPTANAPTRGS